MSSLVVKILRQFERQATWKQDEPEHKRRENQDERLKEMAGDKTRLKVGYGKQTGDLGHHLRVLMRAESVPDQRRRGSTDERVHEVSNSQF